MSGDVTGITQDLAGMSFGEERLKFCLGDTALRGSARTLDIETVFDENQVLVGYSSNGDCRVEPRGGCLHVNSRE